MIPWWAYPACAVGAYLLGAIPSGLLIARARGVDIRRVGSGNIGATNVFRSVGKGWGLLTFACDALKGFLPTFLFPYLVLSGSSPAVHAPSLQVTCAVFAVVGHNWPVTLGFKGGKGIATTAGALFGMVPAAIGIGFLAWLVMFLLTRYVSVASLSAALAVAAVGWIRYGHTSLLMPLTLSALAVIAIWRHRSNIQRLLSGTENRFQFRRSDT